MFGNIVMIVIALVVAFFAWAFWEESKRIAKLAVMHTERAAELAAQTAKYNADRRAFIEAELDGVDPEVVEINGRKSMFSYIDGRTEIRLIQLASDVYRFAVTDDKTISFDDIRTVEFVHDDVIEKYTRVTTTPVAVLKEKSAIGRGLVGGVLLGPVGLVLGAASGISPSSKVIKQTTRTVEDRTVKGPPTLLITTRERENPFIRVEFANVDKARSLALWLGDQLAA